MAKLVCVLTIAGLDPGGGAGVAADLRAIHRAGAFGCPVVAMTTVQSTDGIRSAWSLPSREVVAMAKEVLRAQNVKAIKIGALGSIQNAIAVSQLLKRQKGLPVVVDPVMVASRGGSRLLERSALGVVRRDLLPRATLLTPNVPEANALTGRNIVRLSDAKDAAKALCDMGANAVLIKGGHLAGARAIDVLATQAGEVHEVATERLPIRTRLHGGGCTLASLIAAKLAQGEELLPAVQWAKRALTRSLRDLANVGGHLRVIAPYSTTQLG